MTSLPDLRFHSSRFVKSVHRLDQLPDADRPEIAFAGRSNVGKSSLINRLLNRRGLVKVSARPGKTQSLNYFDIDEAIYLVDLPGYGYAKVPQALQQAWQELVTGYLESRPTLRCVVVIIDLRHPLKSQDRELIGWLRAKEVPYLPVYTKIDKLSRNQQLKQAAALDAGLNIRADERVLFSARTGEGRDGLAAALDRFL
ncbi:MAG: ribosome biogenesis GTP-binding protein YihA/YsxC [Deltaproteobacteria bacterium]